MTITVGPPTRLERFDDRLTVQKPPGRATFIRGRATWVLYLLLALFAYLETLMGPAMPVIRSQLHLSYTVASLHFSAFALGGIVAGAVGERVVHRTGRNLALWGGMGGMAVGIAIMAASPSVSGTLLGALLAGGIGTIALMANQSALSDLHGATRSIAIAESNVAASSAAVIAPLAIGLFDNVGAGWRVALLLGVPLLLLLWLPFHGVPMPEAEAHTRINDPIVPLPRAYWFFWGVLFLVAAVEWCVAYWGADFLHQVVGLKEGTAASAMSIFFAAMVAGRAAGAHFTRRYRGSGLLLIALGLALIGFPVFWLASTPMVNLVGLFVAGIGIANFYPLSIGAATDAAAQTPDRATARLAIAGGGSLLLCPLIVGAISDVVGMRWGFGLVAPLLLAAIVVTLLARRETRKTTA